MKTKTLKLNIEISEEVREAVDFLKSEYAINISAFVRKSILKLKKDLENHHA